MGSKQGRSAGVAWRALCSSLSLLLVLSPLSVSAQTPPISASSPSSIESILTNLTSNSKLLETQLAKQKISYEQAEKQVNELLRELSEVRSLLQESLEHSARSEAEVRRLTRLLQLSEQTSADLRSSFEEYRRAVTWKLISAAIIAFFLGAAAGAAAGIIFE